MSQDDRWQILRHSSGRRFARQQSTKQQEPNMKLNDLKKAVAKARQDRQLAERQAVALRHTAKAAKAKAEQARLEQKLLRKVAKEAKKLALDAEGRACDRCQALEKAQKRLAKALKKSAPQNSKQKIKPASARPSAAS